MKNMVHIPALSVVVNCPQCGDRARLYGIEPHVRLPRTELHTYVCDICSATEVLVVPLPLQTNEVPAGLDRHAG